jgi:DNA-binding Lrp family transcriptional regulator
MVVGKSMSLRPQDILCSLKIACLKPQADGKPTWSFAELAGAVGLSKGEAHNSVKRALSAGLVQVSGGLVTVAPRRLHGFLVHGLATAYYPVRGPVAKGTPTGLSAQFLASKCQAPTIPLVWKWEEGGKVSGETLEPLYPTVPQAAAGDAQLYELLVLCDVLRVAGQREKKLAEGLLEKILLPVG